MSSENKKTKSGNKKQSLVCTRTSQKRTSLRLQNKCDQTITTLPKCKGLTIHPHKSKCQVGNSLKSLVKCEKPQKNIYRKKVLSDSTSKYLNLKPSKISKEKQHKYIFNCVGNVKTRDTLTVKPRNSSLSSHSKSYSNKTLIKNTCDPRTNSAFNKTSNGDFHKNKKETQQSYKKFQTKIYLKENILKGSHSLGNQLSQTLGNMKFDKQIKNTWKTNLNTSKMGTQQFKYIENGHQNKLKQVRLNTNSLFNKLKYPYKEKLSLIANGYEKIVSELYGILTKKKSLPDCYLSRINTNDQNRCQQPVPQLNRQTKVFFSNPIKYNLFENQNPFKASHVDETDSQHWDSYLDYSQNKDNMRNSLIVKTASQKGFLVKKLNLADLKKQPIKQYHEEFMENQEYFSDSWKRQLNHQKMF